MLKVFVCSDELSLVSSLLSQRKQYQDVQIGGVSTIMIDSIEALIKKGFDILLLRYDMDVIKAKALLEQASLAKDSIKIVMLFDSMSANIFSLIDVYEIDYFLVKPYDAKAIFDVLQSLPLELSYHVWNDSQYIVKYLKRLCIPVHLLGYEYFKTGISLYLQQPMRMQQLYEAIAKKHNTTSARVERCMRHAINSAYEQQPQFALINHQKPRVSHVIRYVSEQIKLLGVHYG